MSLRCSPTTGAIPALAITKSTRPNSAHAIADHCLDPLEITDVALLGDDAAAGLLDEVDGFVEILTRGPSDRPRCRSDRTDRQR